MKQDNQEPARGSLRQTLGKKNKAIRDSAAGGVQEYYLQNLEKSLLKTSSNAPTEVRINDNFYVLRTRSES